MSTAKAPARKWTAGEVVAALRRHYGDGYALVEQVANGTGYRADRHLDVVAFGLWPSRGLAIHGIEVKVSKADLKRELAQPDKAESVATYCDRFYIAAPADIVADTMGLGLDMLVPGWGILAVSGEGDATRVGVVREATGHESKAIDRGFVAAVLRRLPNLGDEERTAIRNQVWEEHHDAIKQAGERGAAAARAEIAALRERIREAEAASGIPITEWASSLHRSGIEPRRVGEAVMWFARASSGGYDSLLRRMEGDANTADAVARRLAETAGQLRYLAEHLTPDTDR